MWRTTAVQSSEEVAENSKLLLPLQLPQVDIEVDDLFSFRLADSGNAAQRVFASCGPEASIEGQPV
ncbi:UNVERIFIED_CONTAM: hypothetical protein RKD43_006135 [Streptomyces graminofaciens]